MFKTGIINFFIMSILLISLSEESFSQIDKKQNYNEAKKYYESNLQDINPDRKKGNKWFYRWLWDNRFDIKPDGSLNVLPNFTGFDNLINKDNDRLQSNNSWIPLGPDTDVPTYEYRSGHGLGRVNCVGFHPTDPDVLWVGTPGGGVWKTENSGQSWSPLSDYLPTLAVSHIAVDPVNPEILYFCSGDYDTGGMSSGAAMGVYKSIDGGNSWVKTSLSSIESFKNSMLRKLIINPENTDELITAGTLGIWKSIDAGEIWYPINDSLITDMEIDPSNSNILYAAMGTKWNAYGSAGILKSTDFGDTWTELNTGIPPKNAVSRMKIAVAPSNPNFIYALNVHTQTSGLHSIYMSSDAGNTWQLKSERDSIPNILGAYNGDKNDQRGQGTYDLTLLVDPLDEKKIYTGGINIWMSEDEGKSFEIVSLWINVFGKSIHADHHFSAYNPLNKYIYFCNDGGIYRSKSIKPGKASWITDYIDRVAEDIKPGSPDTLKFPTVWENISPGLNITEFYRLNISKNNPGYVSGGAQDNSCYFNPNSTWINYMANWDGMETMINYDNPDIIYGIWQNGGLCRSDDGGRTVIKGVADTIRNLGERGLWITPSAMDPINPAHIYIGYRNVWKSSNHGNNWTKILDFDSKLFDTVNFNSISILRTSYSHSGYVAVYKSIAWDYENQKNIPAELWLTKNSGETWFKSVNNLPLDSMIISSLEFDNNNPDKLWAAVYTTSAELNLFVSDDFGQSWVNTSKILPSGVAILSIVRDPASDRNIIYAGTNKGVLYTDDSLDTWLPYMENLPIVKVNELEIQPQTGELYAATYGRGIWKTATISSVKDNKLNENLRFEIYPNPVKNRLNLKFGNNSDFANLPVQISIIDIAGRIVYNNNSHTISDNSDLSLDVNFLPGVYFITLKGSGMNYSQKFIIVK